MAGGDIGHFILDHYTISVIDLPRTKMLPQLTTKREVGIARLWQLVRWDLVVDYSILYNSAEPLVVDYSILYNSAETLVVDYSIIYDSAETLVVDYSLMYNASVTTR